MQEAAQKDIDLTRRALELAAHGVGLVSPSPLVGCVITSAAGEIVGEATYIYDNVTHAEVAALEQAGERALGGTAYVSLEPHDHHGKTPPCTDALINSGIARVVCPIEDPNPLVSGRGFQRLADSNIEVMTGLLSDEASRLNEKFICWHRNQRPFVHLKMAISLDGRISLNSSVSTALSGEMARGRVQELRHEYDAILVGGNTALVDDPNLTDRSGRARRRPLIRVVLDNRLRTPAASHLAAPDPDSPTIIFTNSKNDAKVELLRDNGVEIVVSPDGGRDLNNVIRELYERDIQSVLVEGGSEIAATFLEARLVDKVTVIIAPLIIGGRSAPAAVAGSGASTLDDALRLVDLSVHQLGEDIEITGYCAK
ncbi:MAG: bifunctional diaminohydroxyphosphoribosylaminopyrimidine deaminase/5-amino-6-(5-phosphoribosylamino)uracil reductase RibD [Pyrinomonadaceae bacterium]